MPIKKDRQLKKAAAAIHCGNRNISLAQRKIYNALLWNASQHLLTQNKFTIPVSRLIAIAQMQSKNIKYVKENVMQLMSIIVEWDLFRDGKTEWAACQLLGPCRISGGVLTYSILDEIKPMLLDPKVYALIKLNIANLFDSKYAMALYENCLRYVDAGSTGWRTVGEWQNAIGAPDTKLYKSFAELNSRIIKPAIKKVNAVSDIEISADYEARSGGKSITHIRFTVTKRKDYSQPPHIMEQLPLFSPEDMARNAATMKPWKEKLVRDGILTPKT